MNLFLKALNALIGFFKECLIKFSGIFFIFPQNMLLLIRLIVLGFNDMSTLVGHFVSSPREREKRDRRDSRGDEREGQGINRKVNESEETEEIKSFPLNLYLLQS